MRSRKRLTKRCSQPLAGPRFSFPMISALKLQFMFALASGG